MSLIAETPRLIIRRFTPDEEDLYVGLFDDERVVRYLPAYNREKHVEIFRAALEEPVSGSVSGRWGIYNKADGDFVGMCLLRPHDDGSESIEVGYSLAYKYWGRGVASEMILALLTRALTIRPDTHFVAVTEFENIASQKVLEKAGLKRKGDYVRNGIELALFAM